MTQTTNYGRIAYMANQDTWPPKEQYVDWEMLTDTARHGWSKIAAAVLEARQAIGEKYPS